jgi:hypothetical protein
MSVVHVYDSPMDELDQYRQQIGRALRDLMQWADQKREAEQQMSKLRNLIIANANLLPDHERTIFMQQANGSFSGFTDTIREIFRTHPTGLTPTKVRDKLVEAGFDLSAQSNPMASIHSVIRRLIEAGQIRANGDADIGGYIWVEPLRLRTMRSPLETAMQLNATPTGNSQGDFNPKLGYPNPTNTQRKVRKPTVPPPPTGGDKE